LAPRDEWAFGFLAGRSPEQLALFLRLLCELAMLRDKVALIVSCDIRAAFDALDRSRLAEILMQVPGASADERAALFALARLLGPTKVRFDVAGTVSCPVAMQSGVPQGGPEAPGLFAIALAGPLREFQRICEAKGWGVCFGTHRYCLAVFADDVYIIAGAASQAAPMLQLLRSLLTGLSLELAPEKSRWMGIGPDLPAALRLGPGDPVPRAEALTALGVTIRAAAVSDRQHWARRKTAAWRAFAQMLPLLRCRRTPLRLRMSLLESGVRDSLLWGAGAAYLREADVAEIRAVQRTMVSRLLRFARPEGQTDGAFFAGRQRTITRTLAWFQSDWGQTALLRHFRAAADAAVQGQETILGRILREMPPPVARRGPVSLPLAGTAVGRWAHRWDLRAWNLLSLPAQFPSVAEDWAERRLGGFGDWWTLAAQSDLWGKAVLLAAPTTLPIRR
jgi:hypothetical protein